MTAVSLQSPVWRHYRSILQSLFPDGLSATPLPGCEVLNQELAGRVAESTGRSMRFVPAGQLPAVAYESHIFRTGEISTRENSWHDLFNAAAWARFPRIKSALNARHIREIERGHESQRGPVRDTLTLFDECGAIVVSDSPTALEALARRNWQQLFVDYRSGWQQQLRVFVLGHALLEKFLAPYKAITAQALLLRADKAFMEGDDDAQAGQLDRFLANRISEAKALGASAELSPLPLMGIPGWWPLGPQDESFYADNRVFRPVPEGREPATITRLQLLHESTG